MTGAPGDELWRRSTGEVAAAMRTDPHAGLSRSEAAQRLSQYGPNRLDEEKRRPGWLKFLDQFRNPLIYLLLAAVAISLLAWAVERDEAVPYDALVIAAIVLANAVLGYVQEARAGEAVAALQQTVAATATIVRDGEVQRLPADELVPGDVVLLAEGDAVGADARLVEAAALTVIEASLTGESEPVLKDTAALAEPAELGDRVNMVFGGTAVVRGRGRAIVTATGSSTEIGRVARLLESTRRDATPLERELERIGRTLGLAVVAITAVVVAAIFLTSDVRTAGDVVDVLLVGVSLAVAAVPESLPAVLTVVLALGAQRMARRRAIVKRLSSVETLGSASVICTDKTGTLTQNEMTIQTVVTGSGEVEITGVGYRPEGELRVDGRPLDDAVLLDEVGAVLVGGSVAGNAAVEERDGGWHVRGDPTDAAFLVAEAKVAGLREGREERFARRAEIPFTYERKLMSTVQDDVAGDLGTTIVTKGAPEALLTRCTAERVAGDVRPLGAARRRAILDGVDRLADRAYRTLAVAYRPVNEDEATVADESIERQLVYLGVVGMLDPPRPEVKPAIAEARRAGIRVVMITGDHPRAAARIADDLGIASVHARVSPEQKLGIVDALHAEGHVVAMTGDGVNDAPALKAADIGVAMGVTGTDVAKEAADMVLADDNFATIVAAVREGRGIYANIRKFLRFLLSSNMGEILTMFLGVVFAGLIGLDATGEAVAVPLLATQILWINLLTDSAPALALGVDPPTDDVMRRPPRRLSDRAIDGRMWIGVAGGGLVMAIVTLAALDLALAGGLLGGSGGIDKARTMAFTTLVLAQLVNCFNARSDHTSAFRGLFTNGWLWAAVALSLLLQVAVVELPFLNDAFDTTPLRAEDWLLCAGLASVVLWTNEAQKLVARWSANGRRNV